MKLSDWLLELFFPPKCIFCEKLVDSGEKRVCPECDGNVLPILTSACRRHGDFFRVCVVPFRYGGLIRSTLHRMKFGGQPVIAAEMGRYVAQCVKRETDLRFDIVTFVPLMGKRRFSRGYDQAELICRSVASHLNLNFAGTLKKVRRNRVQSTILDEAKRRANVVNAYRLLPGADVRGKRILLIDDIITTGSTLSECSRTLLMAGAESVTCAACASAERKNKSTVS